MRAAALKAAYIIERAGGLLSEVYPCSRIQVLKLHYFELPVASQAPAAAPQSFGTVGGMGEGSVLYDKVIFTHTCSGTQEKAVWSQDTV